ncbi:serine/threonine protein kinase [Actinomadura darangshiensis]|uniref:non-specific serine/threonine protein kinase n=1 Tax=Actinomadura darangshiensis TaxID=705336 RepID=A0A4V6PES5_9ACTN|nr:serine/threonine-protein kinase [Actinomadura darangshiensis]TDD79507.1 serine/threonine protein kinase [Actinomadura darangshiensis]
MLSGDVITGRYRLDAEIGRGGMGIVWGAHDQSLERRVAMKRLQVPDDLAEEDRDALKGRFLREARAAAGLDHPSIINVHDVIEDDDGPWIVMQYVQGRSLEQIVRAGGPLPVARAAQVGLALLDALDCAHEAGILHRDVKPANVLIADDGRVVLTDFGIAAVSNATAYTRTGGFVGTPVFMAPERFRTGTPGPPSDLWSLGATLYMAVEGHPPFQADELEVLIGRLLMGDDPAFVRSGALEPVLRGLLERDPGKRWDSRHATQGLKAVEDGRTPTRPLVATPRKSRQGVLVIAGLLVLVLAGVGVSVPFLLPSDSGPKDEFESIPDACAIVRNGPVLTELMSNPKVSEILDWGPYQDHDDADACTWSDVVRDEDTFRTVDGTFAIRASLPRRSTVAGLPHWTKVPGLGDAAVRESKGGDGQSDWHSEKIIFTLRNAEIGVYLSESPDKRTDAERQTRVLHIAEIIERALTETL